MTTYLVEPEINFTYKRRQKKTHTHRHSFSISCCLALDSKEHKKNEKNQRKEPTKSMTIIFLHTLEFMWHFCICRSKLHTNEKELANHTTELAVLYVRTPFRIFYFRMGRELDSMPVSKTDDI